MQASETDRCGQADLIDISPGCCKWSKGSTINHLGGRGAKRKKISFGGFPKKKKNPVQGASEK